ncbi:MAG TPA: DUF6496 domain-containing protein [Flavisolibacter sp.]|nr:DUF6496 domain-containing protein [Flavisolibacter sp.]
MAKYSKRAGEKVEKAMHEKKRGQLKSGRSGKKVTSRKQAIAIGLSEARKEGAKVPKKGGAKKAGAKKSAAKKGVKKGAKKTGIRKVGIKKAGAKKASASKRGGAKKGAKKGGRKTSRSGSRS